MEKRVLIARWLGSNAQSIPIYDEASVSSARQRVREAALTFNASEKLAESVALIASELTHNQLAHSRQGYFSVRVIEREGARGLEVVAADMGPGLQKPILSGNAGHQVEGSLGAGLEGVFRMADEVDVDSRGTEGLCVVARKFETKMAPSPEVAIAGQPYPGEVISGDDAACISTESGFLAAICDGLGHGPEARDASNKAIESITRNSHLSDLREIIVIVNAEIAATRGCALVLARLNQETRKLQCVSVGDIRAHLYHLRHADFLTSTPGVVGDRAFQSRRLRTEEITMAPGAVLAMFSDGLESKANLKGQLDLLRKPAITIAQHLLKTYSRGTDDALVFVARARE